MPCCGILGGLGVDIVGSREARGGRGGAVVVFVGSFELASLCSRSTLLVFLQW